MNPERMTPTTTDAGIPMPSDDNSLTIGPDGPILLHDDHYLMTDPASETQRKSRFERDALPLTHQLFTAALRLTRNTQYAEDLAQEVMLRAYAGFGSFPDDTSLKAWLYRILHKTWISQYRKGNPNLMRYRWSASPTCN
jgi:RNA polymerase sigma-70 factor (ECF subfamily)